jgi:hypothetical protein
MSIYDATSSEIAIPTVWEFRNAIFDSRDSLKKDTSLDAHQKFGQLAQGSRMAQASLEESLRLARRTAVYVLRTRMVEAMCGKIRTWVIHQGIDAETRIIAEVTELGRCEAVMSECQFIAIERKIQLRIRRTDRRSHRPVISGKIVITG